MSVVTCRSYRVVFTRDQQDLLVRKIALWGKFEPVEPILPARETSQEQPISQSNKVKQKYQDAISYVEEQRPASPIHAEAELEKAVSIVFDKYADSEKELEVLMANVAGVQKAKDTLSEYEEKTKDFRLFFTNPEESKVYIKLFAVPTRMSSAFADRANQETSVMISLFYAGHEETYFTCVYSDKTSQAFVDDIFKTYEGRDVTMKDVQEKETLNSLQEKITTKLEQLQESLAKANDKMLVHYDKNSTVFKCLIDLLEYEQQVSGLYKYIGYFSGSLSKEEVRKLPMLRKGNQFALTGWISPADVNEFTSLVHEVDADIALEEAESAEEETRTVLQNNKWVKPFELITKLMGVPSTKEIDPTPIFSPIFILFFGFALGDGGYGIIMLIASLWGLFRMKLSASMRESMLLVFLLSISTIFFGAITGSWFGVDLKVVPGSLGAILKSMKWFDMQGSMIFVLAGTIATGFSLQIVSLILELWTHVKNKDYLSAIAFPGTWILLLLAIVARVMVGSLGMSEGAVQIATYVLYASFGAFLIGQGIKARPIYIIPLAGLGQLFNIMGFLSNSLSYARLLALGLATGVIGSVINSLSVMAGGTDSILGIIIMITILVIGHTVNIAINLLGTFITAMRLQMVEFFPRFFTAMGIELAPVKLVTTYFPFTEKMVKSYERNFSLITNYEKKNL